MHTLRLEVSDNLLTKVVSFLHTLPKSDIKLSTPSQTNSKKFTSISIKTKGYKFDRNEANGR